MPGPCPPIPILVYFARHVRSLVHAPLYTAQVEFLPLPSMGQIYLGDNLPILRSLPDASCRLIYIDPPFNTGTTQRRNRIQVTRDDATGTRSGFGDARYAVTRTASPQYADSFDDF